MATEEQRLFLASASTFNERFGAVRAGSTQIPLQYSFWTLSEIEKAQQIQADWDVPPKLVPFYGDWHDLICLNVESGAVEMIDDTRHPVFVWLSHDDFQKCLASVAETPGDTSGVIETESWLDF